MKQKSVSLFVCMLLILTIIPISTTVFAGNSNNPEIVDDVGDTDLVFLDIESAWFYEDPSEPDYLYISLKINDLKKNFNAVFSIRWTYNEVVYVAGLDTFSYKSSEFRCGLRQRATFWQWKSMPRCEGTFDQSSDIITWKISKNNIGNPKQGNVLTNTECSAVAGFPFSILYLIMGVKDRDFVPDEYGTYGENYIIKY